MIFGKRSVRHDFGAFESDACPACGKGTTYRFACVARYAVVLFINLIPAPARYETVCEECGDTQTLTAAAGRGVAKEFFARPGRALFTAHALRLGAAIAVIAAVALALILTLAPAADPQTLKNLAGEDGVYSIQTFDGGVLGIVEAADGEKLLTFYNDSSVLVGEPGAEGRFTRHEYFREAVDGAGETALVRDPAAPGVLKDRHDTVVRLYEYDQALDTLRYATGVEDLSAIVYTPGKAVYPFSHYSDDSPEPTPYTVVVYLSPDSRIEATFGAADAGAEALDSLVIKELENGRVATETIYDFDAAARAQAQAYGLSPDSGVDDITGFIETYAPAPLMAARCTYYKNTRVLAAISLSLPDGAGGTQTYEQKLDVTEKAGFYIVQVPAD